MVRRIQFVCFGHLDIYTIYVMGFPVNEGSRKGHQDSSVIQRNGCEG